MRPSLLILPLLAASCAPSPESAVPQKPIPASPSYSKLVFDAPFDREIQSLLLALAKEEPNLSRDERPGATKADEDAASAAADRCNDLEDRLIKKTAQPEVLRLLDHLILSLSEREDASNYEIYILDAFGKSLQPGETPLYRLRDEEWRPLFTALLKKGQAAKQRWKGSEAHKLYLGVSAELMRITFKSFSESPPALPASEAADWEAQMDRFNDWVRQRLAKP